MHLYPPMPSLLREAVLDALAVLLPIDCAGCGHADRALCADCRAAVDAGTDARSSELSGVPMLSALRYDGVVREAILAFKEQGRTDIARVLAAPLARVIELAASTRVEAGIRLELCTVPTSRAAWRRRGYDPTTVLLRAAGLRTARRILRTGAATSAGQPHEQKRLDRTARSRNRAGSLTATRSLAGRRFIIVDDVLTTGATLTEAIRAIRKAGGNVHAGVTLAYTPKLFGSLGERS